MGKRVDLKLAGDLEQQGFEVTLEISHEGAAPFFEERGGLPASKDLLHGLEQWQQSYRNLAGATRIILQGVTIQTGPLSYPEQLDRCRQLAQTLEQQLNHWLASAEFAKLDQHLRERLSPEEPIRVLLRTHDRRLHHLPWHLWNFFDRYPHTEFAIGSPTFQTNRLISAPSHPTVRILAILGDASGISTETDRQQLERLPNAEVLFLSEPSRQEMVQQIWEQSWHILFFAGHSRTEHHQGQDRGRIFINAEESLTLGELRKGLQQAVSRGLQLAIFNSCDGLGLAYELEQIHLPQLIVMRQPVPDRVAQTFLQYFLSAFISGQSSYLAVRQARERLQEELDPYIPCTAWLPVIWQNPAAIPLTWRELAESPASIAPSITPTQPNIDRSPITPHSRLLPRPNWRSLAIVGLIGLVSTGLVSGVRSLGKLEFLELIAFDHFMRQRPDEKSDPKLLIIEITDEDIQTQHQNKEQLQKKRTTAKHQGEIINISLSDQSLERLLAKLAKPELKPSIIGLDIYRDFGVAEGQPKLAEYLKNSSIFAVCKAENLTDTTIPTIDPPPEVPIERIGLSDADPDQDQTLRRHLLYLPPLKRSAESKCTTNDVFSVQIAFAYLAQRGIPAVFLPDGNDGTLKLGQRSYHVRSTISNYQNLKNNGSQIILNYRAALGVAPRISLTDFLNHQINPLFVKDKIVLIGVTAGERDKWQIPGWSNSPEHVPGVIVQAHMISQLVNAALPEEQRPLIQTWEPWGNGLWILAWSTVSGMLVLQVTRHQDRPKHLFACWGLIVILLSGGLCGICFVMLLQGWWVPLIPSVMGIVLSSGTMGVCRVTQISTSSLL